jgi:hypothetical protein
VEVYRRQVASKKSGDKSPHSKKEIWPLLSIIVPTQVRGDCKYIINILYIGKTSHSLLRGVIMNKALVKSAVLGGIVVFLWGVITWMVLPINQMSMCKFDDEQAVAQAIQSNTQKSGAYVLPNLFKMEKSMNREGRMRTSKEDRSMLTSEEKAALKDKAMQRMRAGPVVFAVVNKEGMNTSSVSCFIMGLVVQIIAAGFVTYLLMMTKAMSYMRQVWFVTMAGAFAAFAVIFPNWVWIGYAGTGHAVMSVINLLIAWFLAGLVIAKIAKAR